MLTASLVPGLCLGCVPLLGADTAAVLAVTSLALTCYGSMFCGVFSNHADLAPSLAGTLMAVTNMVATLPGVLSTIISEYCVPRNIINTLTCYRCHHPACCWPPVGGARARPGHLARRLPRHGRRARAGGRRVLRPRQRGPAAVE